MPKIKSVKMNSSFSLEKYDYTQIRKALWDKVAHKSLNKCSLFYHSRLHEVFRLIVPEGSHVLEIGCSQGDLLSALCPKYGLGIDISDKMIQLAREKYPALNFANIDALELDIKVQSFDFIIMSDLINDLWDVQTLLCKLKPYCKAETRLIFNFYSHLWQVPLKLAHKLGIAKPFLTQNWLTVQDVTNLLELENYKSLRSWQEIILPLPIPGANIVNQYLSKVFPFRWLALTNFLVARPLIAPKKKLLTATVLVPARNEEGHIDEIISRIPKMGAGTEIIFVEGHSTDGTFNSIKLAIEANPTLNCKLIKQPGKGKGDAVRAGFAQSTGNILMILDADMTVPPEELTRFYEVIANNKGEFINGVRLVYPMDDYAMRFFNIVGNKFFAGAFSWLLGQPIRDTLCGTKVISRNNYDKIALNRKYFGDFDPFGDFDLLFGAAKQNLDILEIPIRYRSRKYGETNINRWRHGWLLLKMVLFAARRIKFV